MINPLARMLGQAEVNFADLSRRAVESVTVPIRLKSQEIVADTVDAASRAVKTIVIKGVLGLVAAAMAIVAVVYLVGALEEALLPALGLVKTRLGHGRRLRVDRHCRGRRHAVLAAGPSQANGCPGRERRANGDDAERSGL